MGVLMKSGSALNETPSRPESGVAVVAEAADLISEGKLLVTGVATSSLGLGPGILKRGNRRLLLSCEGPRTEGSKDARADIE